MSAAEPYWCSSTPNVPRVWSASSIATIADCPRRFELAYIEGWSAKEEGLDATFGSRFHEGMRVFIENLIAGTTREEAIDRAILASWQDPLPAPRKIKQAGKTALGLARAIVAYADTYQDDPAAFLIVNGKPQLEVPFRFVLPLANPDGEPYAVRGYIDYIRDFSGALTAGDYKTTGSALSDWYFQKFEINVQNYIYSGAMQVLENLPITQFLVDAVAVTQYNDVDLQRKPISVTKGEVDEGITDVLEQIRLAEHFAQRNYYPKNTSACTFCQFNGICNKDPGSREAFLKSDFIEKRRTTVEDH